MKLFWKYRKMKGKISDSAFILYLSQLIGDMCYKGNMPEDIDFEFIKRQFEERGFEDYYSQIFENFYKKLNGSIR